MKQALRLVECCMPFLVGLPVLALYYALNKLETVVSRAARGLCAGRKGRR